MDLLRLVTAGALEAEYLPPAQQTPPTRRSRALLVITVGIAVALLTIAAVQTQRGATAAEAERSDLLARISKYQQQQESLRTQLQDLQREVRDMRSAVVGEATSKELAAAELAAGGRAVQGPGIVVHAEDALDASRLDGRIIDQDLSQLVNGLFESGAEAVSVNDHRITSTTAIRGAGSAITVDYRSLTHPYRIEAVGDPNGLQQRFVETEAASWWEYLRLNYGVRYSISPATDLHLGADPTLNVSFARPGAS